MRWGGRVALIRVGGEEGYLLHVRGAAHPLQLIECLLKSFLSGQCLSGHHLIERRASGGGGQKRVGASSEIVREGGEGNYVEERNRGRKGR